MGSCKAEVKFYDSEGRWFGASHIYLPDNLDWMPIDVKCHWFTCIGQGPVKAHFALLTSQGEQRLIINVSLTPLDHKTYKERLEKSHEDTEKFIDEGGYSREPRNQ